MRITGSVRGTPRESDNTRFRTRADGNPRLDAVASVIAIPSGGTWPNALASASHFLNCPNKRRGTTQLDNDTWHPSSQPSAWRGACSALDARRAAAHLINGACLHIGHIYRCVFLHFRTSERFSTTAIGTRAQVATARVTASSDQFTGCTTTPASTTRARTHDADYNKHETQQKIN